MRRAIKLTLLVIASLAAQVAVAQKLAPTTEDAQPCNDKRTFCWYGPYRDGSGEVTAWGTVFKADDPNEKPLEGATEVRCLKELRVCIRARNEKEPSWPLPDMTYIDIFPVNSWTKIEIRAAATTQSIFNLGCEKVTLVLNRVEQSVLLVSSPGPFGKEKRCTLDLGPMRTVVYRLAFH